MEQSDPIDKFILKEKYWPLRFLILIENMLTLGKSDSNFLTIKFSDVILIKHDKVLIIFIIIQVIQLVII